MVRLAAPCHSLRIFSSTKKSSGFVTKPGFRRFTFLNLSAQDLLVKNRFASGKLGRRMTWPNAVLGMKKGVLVTGCIQSSSLDSSAACLIRRYTWNLNNTQGEETLCRALRAEKVWEAQKASGFGGQRCHTDGLWQAKACNYLQASRPPGQRAGLYSMLHPCASLPLTCDDRADPWLELWNFEDLGSA